MNAWFQFGANPLSTRDRRMFYLHYLTDVVPFEISIVHIPREHQPYDITEESRHYREEIQLQ